MANSFDSSFVLQVLGDRAIMTLGNSLAPLEAFSTDFTKDTEKRGGIVNVQKYSVGAMEEDPSTYINTDITSTTIPVTLTVCSKTGGLSHKNLQDGKSLEQFVDGLAYAVANGVKSKVNALITTAYNNTAISAAQASFGATEAKKAYGSLKSGRKSLILDNTAFAQLLPSALTSFPMVNGAIRNGLYGFEAIYPDSNLTSMGVSTTYGFAATPEAIVVASRLPEMPEGHAWQTRILELPNGLKVQLGTWIDNNTLARYVNLQVLFGAARGDTTALTRIEPS